MYPDGLAQSIFQSSATFAPLPLGSYSLLDEGPQRCCNSHTLFMFERFGIISDVLPLYLRSICLGSYP